MVTLNWIDATDLNLWANRRAAQGRLPQVVRRLVHATVERRHCHRVSFRAGEGVQLGGWDGLVKVSEGNAFVPDEVSAWELTTAQDSKGKADDDYQNRCRDPLEVNPSETTFVFVTARRWGNKDEWAKEKSREGPWAEVRVYDADDLEQWLEQAPAVHAWLARLVGKYPEGVQDLGDFWGAWRDSTTPPMNAALGLAGRQEAVERVETWLNDTTSSLSVQSDSREESIAFFAATVFQMPEEDRVPYLARCVISQNEQSWRHLVPSSEHLILIPTFDNLEGVGKAVSGGHHVLIPLGRETSISPNTLSLPPLAKTDIERALIDMGISEERAHALAQESRRDLLVLRRRLAVVPEIHCPSWSKPEAARPLVPVLLAGAWDNTREADRKAIEEIARKPYEEVLATLSRWVNESDPPVRRVGNIWQLVSREDSWHLLARFVMQDDLEVLENVVLSVLGTLDPRYDLPPDQRWAAGLYGKTLPHSSFLRQGLAETLALLATRGEVSGIQDTMSAEDRARRIVWKLFNLATDWRLWCSLSYSLPTLAEAAPEAFLDAVEEALVGESPVFLNMFAQEDPMSGSPHTGLLWALEALAWEPEYLGRVALILAKLTRLDPGGQLSNRPQNSLRAIFSCRRPQTPTTLDQRFKVIDMLLTREPDVAWKLLCSLLSESSFRIPLRIHRPHWREWGSSWRPTVTYSQYCIEKVAEQMLSNAGANGKRWCDVIGHIASLPPRSRDEAIKKLLGIDPADIKPDDRLEFWKKLRLVIRKHRRFANTDWAMPAEVVDKLHIAYQKFEPDNLIDRYMWLFSSWPELLDFTSEDRQVEQDAIERARAEVVTEIYTVAGLSALLDLAARVEQPWQVGFAIAKSEVASDLDYRLLDSTLGKAEVALTNLGIGFVIGRFHAGGWSWAETILSPEGPCQWSPQQQADFVRGLPFERQTWRLLATLGEETEALYWKQVTAYWAAGEDECEEAARMLLAYERPYAALDVASFGLDRQSETLPMSAQLLADILEQAATKDPTTEEPPSVLQSLGYHVERILEVLQRSNDIEDTLIAKLEWTYLPILTHGAWQPRILLLHRELSRNPLFFAQVVGYVYRAEGDERAETDELTEEMVIRAEMGYELLESWHLIPGLTQDGRVDLEQLQAWIIQAREACRSIKRSVVGDQQIGQVLAYAPAAPDGVWPDVAVREVIEEVASKDIETGIYIGVHNRRGVVTRAIGEGGKQEKELAETYRKYAKAVGDSWPRTAALLRKIADSYESEARSEDIHAELEDY